MVGCYHDSHCDSNILGHWMSLPVTATFWSYVFGAVYMGLSSLYYLQRPEKYSLSSEVHMCVREHVQRMLHIHT